MFNKCNYKGIVIINFKHTKWKFEKVCDNEDCSTVCKYFLVLLGYDE